MKINVNKFEKLIVASIKNALRLHEESWFLYQNKLYSTSYFIECIALEEIGKSYIVDDMLFHYNSGETDSTVLDVFIKSTFNHPTKQIWSFSNSISELFRTHEEMFKLIQNKTFEKDKQNSIYAGLNNNQINLPINSVPKTKTKKLIRLVNDELFRISDLINKGIIEWDQNNINDIISKKLQTFWKIKKYFKDH